MDMGKEELRFTKPGIVMPVDKNSPRDTWQPYHNDVYQINQTLKKQLEDETNKRKQLEEHVSWLENELARYKKAAAELQKVTDAVKIWSESSAYRHAGQLMGALHEYEANNGISG